MTDLWKAKSQVKRCREVDRLMRKKDCIVSMDRLPHDFGDFGDVSEGEKVQVGRVWGAPGWEVGRRPRTCIFYIELYAHVTTIHPWEFQHLYQVDRGLLVGSSSEPGWQGSGVCILGARICQPEAHDDSDPFPPKIPFPWNHMEATQDTTAIRTGLRRTESVKGRAEVPFLVTTLFTYPLS